MIHVLFSTVPQLLLHHWVVAVLIEVLIMLRYLTSNGVLTFIDLSCTFRMLKVASVMPRVWKIPMISFPLQTLLALSYPRSDIRLWLSWIQLHNKQKGIQRKCDACHLFKVSPHWLDQTVAEVRQRLVFGLSDVVFDHALQLIPGWQETVIAYAEAGTLSCTVLNVVGLIQHQDLAWQVDIHLEKKKC